MERTKASRLIRSLLVAAFAIWLAAPSPGQAGECRSRVGDRVLLVSTRPVGCTTDAARMEEGVYAAEYSSAAGCGQWNEAPHDALLASLDPTLPVVLYVHGNQIEAPDARRRGLDVYRRLVRCATDDRPIQFVVFSWCSGKVKGLLRDYRVKAARTRPVAWQFAWLLDRLPNGAQIGVLGYSYGARVTSGAAHLIAGGSLSELRYAGSSAGCERCGLGPMRAVFLAAAYDACWNARGRYHGRTLDTIDTLLVTVDRQDPAMKFFKWVSTTSDPPAMGGVGPRGLDRWQASKVQVRNVVSSVGRSHDLYDYLATPGLMRQTWRRLTFVDAPTPSPQPTLAAADATTVAAR